MSRFGRAARTWRRRTAAAGIGALAIAAGMITAGGAGGDHPHGDEDGFAPIYRTPLAVVADGRTVNGHSYEISAFESAQGLCLRLAVGSNPRASEACGFGVPTQRPLAWVSVDDLERRERLLFGPVTRRARTVRATSDGESEVIVDATPIPGIDAAVFVVSFESSREPLRVALAAEDSAGRIVGAAGARFARLGR